MKLLRAALLLLALMAPAARAQFAAVPPLSGHVVDQAGMLDKAQRQKLDSALAVYETKTGNQVAILLVKSTDPEAIEQYSIRVAESWKLGRKGIDDGVLLLVAKDNPPSLRRLRIEAGRGVQGVLTDAQSKRILQDVIAPRFKQKQYYDGLAAGVASIAALLNQERFPPVAPVKKAQAQAAPPQAGSNFLPFLLLIFFGLFMLLRSRGGNHLHQGGWNAGATGFVLGAALDAIAHNAGRGGGFSGGGGGAGGFSGGGGTFDGGGASGDW